MLPLQESLRPNQDTKTGEIETWPAYASRSVSDTGKIARSFSKEVTAIKKSTVPKPKFLSALETYVRKEIVNLGCTDSKPSELRLQAYREVFEYLIEDFKTYKPLLSQIKNEYEKMLSHYRQKIHELEPLKAMLITVSERCDQKIMKIREEERQEILELKKTKMDLLKHIDSMKEQDTSLKAQVAKLQQQLAVEYKKYRDECDMKKLLVSDMNDMRHQQEDLKRAAGQSVVDVEDDPIRLKIALKVAREDLTRQANELTRIQADYGDVIPRRDFQMLETKYSELDEKHNVLMNDFNQLKDEHDTMLEVQKQVMEQRDQFYTQAESLRRSATPRPRWGTCGELVDGGPDNWSQLTTGKTSEQILELLLTEFKARGPQGPEEFEGKGLGEDVPKYLQYNGTVRNRKMKKSEVTSLLKEIWAKKVDSDAERGSREKMTDFLQTFFMEKFNKYEEMAAEWAYSLHDALNYFEKEVHIKVFLDIINGVATEDLYYRHMDILKKLMLELSKISPDRVSPSQLTTAISTSFPLKSESNVEGLVAAALEELECPTDNSPSIEYQALFTEDEEGHTGPFLNLLRAQEDEECSVYLNDISNQLEGMEEVPPGELRNTLMIIDPAIDPQLMINYLKIAYRCPEETINDAEPLDRSVLMENLRKGGVHRVGAVY